jgi:predicted Zn-dependent peptidase
LFDQTIFGADHPYGRTAIGTEATLNAFTTEDLRSFHQQLYTPGNTTFVIAGDIDRATAETLIRSAFGEWAGASVAAHPSSAPAQVSGRTIHLVDKPGAAQSIISIGRVGPARATPDYYALEVMNTILGGSFTSRLNQNLREDKGYTYGARSSFDFGVGTGSFAAGAAVQTDATGPALAEFMNELRAIREPIPDHEIELARSFLAMRYPARFQSVSGIAGAVADLVQYGLSVDLLADYTGRVLSVSATDVNRVANEYLDPDSIAIIVVGDRRIIEPQIRSLALGPIRILEVTDVLGPVPGSGSR